MSAVWLIALSLAAYRLARLLVYDAGPWALFVRLRARLGATPEACARQHNEQPHITNALCCLHCTGLYAALAVYLLWLVLPDAVIVLAMAGALSLMHDYAER